MYATNILEPTLHTTTPTDPTNDTDIDIDI